MHCLVCSRLINVLTVLLKSFLLESAPIPPFISISVLNTSKWFIQVTLCVSEQLWSKFG